MPKKVFNVPYLSNLIFVFPKVLIFVPDTQALPRESFHIKSVLVLKNQKDGLTQNTVLKKKNLTKAKVKTNFATKWSSISFILNGTSGLCWSLLVILNGLSWPAGG